MFWSFWLPKKKKKNYLFIFFKFLLLPLLLLLLLYISIILHCTFGEIWLFGFFDEEAFDVDRMRFVLI